MSLNSKNEQTNKKTLQAKDKVNQAKQGSEAEKPSEKARKEKKKKHRQEQRKKPKSTAIKANTASATGSKGQKKKNMMVKALRGISLKSPVITAIRRAATPGIILS